jgi:hypothetical protein
VLMMIFLALSGMWCLKASALVFILLGLFSISVLCLPPPHSIVRNVAAAQVNGVSLSLYNKYPSKAEAFAAFDQAQRAGHVAVL